MDIMKMHDNKIWLERHEICLNVGMCLEFLSFEVWKVFL